MIEEIDFALTLMFVAIAFLIFFDIFMRTEGHGTLLEWLIILICLFFIILIKFVRR